MNRLSAVESIFFAALEKGLVDRVTYLNEICGSDDGLRRDVERLLGAHPNVGHFLESGPLACGTTGLDSKSSQRPNQDIGPYRLLEEIGAGGMGLVFVAEQTQPVRRKVAIKVIKPGMDSRQFVARFEQERQALALMDHPNIAKVLDAGTTDGESGRVSVGRPYFVMELVKGTPITQYCDDTHLSVRQRLELFADVCEAVQHAHQKGIIHRDVKPSNILVTSHDGKPVVKVIDFGLAKAIGQPLTEKTIHTQSSQMVGTPLYMSPEQAGLSGLDVDTRTDVYALGVLLYELLTGTTPFDGERLRTVGCDEMRRIIREEEPPRPSMRLLESGGALPAISARRHAELGRLRRLVRGELDLVVMKCLEKDRARRYETANGLAMDVRRFLNDEPVLACPPSAGYRFRKFARRNQGPLLTAAFGALAMILGTAVCAWQAFRATEAERLARANEAIALEAVEAEKKSRRQTRVALDTLTEEVVEELLGRQARLTDRHRQFLKKVLGYHASLADDGDDTLETRESRANGCMRVGWILHRLGDFAEAETAYRHGIAVQQRLAAENPSHPEFRNHLAGSYYSLTLLLRTVGRQEEAEAACREGLSIQRPLVADFPDNPDFRRRLAAGHHALATQLRAMRRQAEAERACLDALAIQKPLVVEHFASRPEFALDLAGSHRLLGYLLCDTGRLRDAEAAFRDGLALCKRLIAASDSPDGRQNLGLNHHALGGVLWATGRLSEAEAACREALAVQHQLSAEFPARYEFRYALSLSYNQLGTLLSAGGLPREADGAFREAVALARRLAEDCRDSPEYRATLAGTLLELGRLQRDNGGLRDAEAAVREAVSLARRLAEEPCSRPDLRASLPRAQCQLGLLLQVAGRLPEAEAACREALALQQPLAAAASALPAYRQDQARSYNALGQVLQAAGRLTEAQSAHQSALAVLTRSPELPQTHDQAHVLAWTLVSLAGLHDTRQEFAAGLSLLEQARPYHEVALRACPKHPAYRTAHRQGLKALIRAHLGLADHAGAAGAAGRFAALTYDPANDAYDAACFLGRCALSAAKDDQLSEPRRKELAQGYADRALGLLRQAVERGFKGAADMKTNADLNPLRAREELRRLLEELERRTKG